MIRQVKPSDFYAVTSVIQSWWGGRDLRAKLPKLFFEHFQQTSFVVVEKGELIGFLVGFYRNLIRMKPIFTLLASTQITVN